MFKKVAEEEILPFKTFNLLEYISISVDIQLIKKPFSIYVND